MSANTADTAPPRKTHHPGHINLNLDLGTRQAKSYPKGRVCLGCETVLSRYNPDKVCSPCAKAVHERLMSRERETERRLARAGDTRRRRAEVKLVAGTRVSLEDLAEVKRLSRMGLTATRISELVHLSRTTVGQLISRYIPVDGVYRCPDCARVFSKPQGLNGHRRVHVDPLFVGGGFPEVAL